MKQSLAILAVLILLISCTPKEESSQDVSVLDTILETGILKVGTTGDWIPMSYIDTSTNQHTGHDIELVKELAKDMGVEVEFVKTDWKSFAAGISAGRYHITTLGSYNMGRAKSVGYTNPILHAVSVALAKKETLYLFPNLASINNSTVRVATTLGTVFDELATEIFPNANKIKVESPARDFQELLAGKADISITSSIEAAKLVNDYPNLAIVPEPLPNSNVLGFLTPRDDQELINYLNVWIEQKKSNGYLKKLESKWLFSQ